MKKQNPEKTYIFTINGKNFETHIKDGRLYFKGDKLFQKLSDSTVLDNLYSMYYNDEISLEDFYNGLIKMGTRVERIYEIFKKEISNGLIKCENGYDIVKKNNDIISNFYENHSKRTLSEINGMFIDMVDEYAYELREEILYDKIWDFLLCEIDEFSKLPDFQQEKIVDGFEMILSKQKFNINITVE